MPLDKTRLGQALWTRVKSLNTYGDSMTGAQEAKGLELWTAVADELVKEITTNAALSVTTSTPGAQAGASTLAGSGTGTVS